MMTKKIIMALSMILCSVFLSAQNSDSPKEPAMVPLKKVAVFVRNDSGKSELDKKDKFLETGISSRINNNGFSVISHDLVVRNLNSYLGDVNAKYRGEAEKLKKQIEMGALDNKLFENASGLRVADMIGADYIMLVSYVGLGVEKKNFSGYGINTSSNVYNLRSNYSLCESGSGEGSAGGAIKSSKAIRQTPELSIQSDDILNELIDDTALQIAALLNSQNQSGQIIAKRVSSNDINIIFAIEAMSFPEIVEENGKYKLGANAIPATIPYVVAEIDGIAQSIGGKVRLSKGPHTLKIKQKDIEPIEYFINVINEPNQTLTLPLSLTQEARNRWKSDMFFIESMKDRAKKSDSERMLVEAEVDRIRGIAEMYRKSGYNIQIDRKEDVKIDAKNLPEIKRIQSTFSQ